MNLLKSEAGLILYKHIKSKLCVFWVWTNLYFPPFWHKPQHLQLSMSARLSTQLHSKTSVRKPVHVHHTQERQQRCSLGSGGPDWIDSAGSQRKACLLRCLESAQVVDMQGNGAARSSPALELIKLQTHLAGCPPLSSCMHCTEFWHWHSYRLNTPNHLSLHTQEVCHQSSRRIIPNLTALFCLFPTKSNLHLFFFDVRKHLLPQLSHTCTSFGSAQCFIPLQ